MREQDFIQQYEQHWQTLQSFLNTPERKREISDWADFPAHYRQLCEQLALAQAQGFSPALIARLNRLAVLGNGLLYKKRQSFALSFQQFISLDLPQAVRREWRWVAFSGGIFILSILLGCLLFWLDPDYLSPDQKGNLHQMYEPNNHKQYSLGRLADTDIFMWGYYIFHNTTISLQALAGGALAGIFTFYIVIFNGIHLGSVAAFMVSEGWYWQTFFPFIIAHGAFELTALVFSGAVGFAIAGAIICPQQISRAESVRRCLKRMFPLLIVIILFDFIAAALEAFWSGLVLPLPIKYGVGIVMWALVITYFLKVGQDGSTDH